MTEYKGWVSHLLSSMSLLTPICALAAAPFIGDGSCMLKVFFMSSYHLYLYLYNFHHPLPFGDTKNTFNFSSLWQMAIQLFIYSFHRPLLSSNHMQALRTQRSKILNHVLKNVTVYHIGPLQFLLYRVDTLVPFVLLPVSQFLASLLLYLLNELELIQVP